MLLTVLTKPTQARAFGTFLLPLALGLAADPSAICRDLDRSPVIIGQIQIDTLARLISWKPVPSSMAAYGDRGEACGL